MLDLARLTSFVALLDAGTFTAAAKALGVTKAAVSAHVRKLEEELGSALVLRTTRQVTPTEVGLRLHEAAKDLLAAAERVESQAKQHVGLTGKLRLTSTNEYLSTVLAPHLAAFLRLHPRLRLEVFGSPGLADVVAERYDVAIRFGQPPSSTLKATKLASFRRFPVATPTLVARHGEPKQPEDLARFPWVLHHLHKSPVAFQRGTETRKVTLSSSFVTDVVGLNRRLALGSTGAILGAEWLVEEDIAKGRLVPLLPEWSIPEKPIYAVRAGTGQAPAKVRALIKYLREALAQRPSSSG
ncbi:MAG: LysR family transcriptional regulator [Polyangiaceae bacterium]|nr:LysR family transcriptional regulator [Polyangiaceae bacterium]